MSSPITNDAARTEALGTAPVGFVDRYFKISERGSSIGTEIRGGVTTFLTMAYILFVNPQILAATGMPAQDVAIAHGISVGIVSYTVLRLLIGRYREIHPITAVLTVLLILYYAVPGGHGGPPTH